MSKKDQQLAAWLFGLAFVLGLVALAVAFPHPTPFQYQVFRVLLALAAAGVAAMIPGSLEVNISDWLRAGGALGFFVVVYFCNPAALVASESPPPPPQPVAPVVRITKVPPVGEVVMATEEIAGKVERLKHPERYRIVIYAYTDHWYVQPDEAQPLTNIDENGKWSNSTHLGKEYAAILVSSTYKPQKIAAALPSAGADIFAFAVTKAGNPK